MLLPLIYALGKSDRSERRHIINIIKRHSDKPEKVKEVIEYVHQSGGLEYTREAMYDFRSQAFDILHTFPISPARQSLEDLVNFVTDRRK